MTERNELLEHEQKLEAVLNSGLAPGHKVQDILELYGIENRYARPAARVIATVVANHLKLLGKTFVENGHSQCGRALLFEAENLFGS